MSNSTVAQDSSATRYTIDPFMRYLLDFTITLKQFNIHDTFYGGFFLCRKCNMELLPTLGYYYDEPVGSIDEFLGYPIGNSESKCSRCLYLKE